MESNVQVAKKGNRKFIIEQDNPDIGWYFHVYEGNNSLHDSLQDSEQQAKQEAKKDWGVDFDAWS